MYHPRLHTFFIQRPLFYLLLTNNHTKLAILNLTSTIPSSWLKMEKANHWLYPNVLISFCIKRWYSLEFITWQLWQRYTLIDFTDITTFKFGVEFDVMRDFFSLRKWFSGRCRELFILGVLCLWMREISALFYHVLFQNTVVCGDVFMRKVWVKLVFLLSSLI